MEITNIWCQNVYKLSACKEREMELESPMSLYVVIEDPAL